MKKDSRTVSRLLAVVSLIVALMLTFDLKPSGTMTEDWDLDITVGWLNTALFILSLLLFIVSSRLGKTARETKGFE